MPRSLDPSLPFSAIQSALVALLRVCGATIEAHSSQ